MAEPHAAQNTLPMMRLTRFSFHTVSSGTALARAGRRKDSALRRVPLPPRQGTLSRMDRAYETKMVNSRLPSPGEAELDLLGALAASLASEFLSRLKDAVSEARWSRILSPHPFA